MKTALCHTLEVEHPIIAAPMGPDLSGPELVAAVSNAGGNPGFVAIADSQTLIWPDYVGNNMFNTLGNIAANPQAGLLFLDFDTGSTLQLTGEASIIWDAAQISEHKGAVRLVSYRIEQALEIDRMLPLRWQFESYSQFNP